MVGVRGDEHHHRRMRQSAQFIGELQAVASGHVDVGQHQVASRLRGAGLGVRALTMLLQPHHRLRGVGGFADHRGARLGARLDQAAQAPPGQVFVIDEQDAQRLGGRAHSGTSMSTRK